MSPAAPAVEPAAPARARRGRRIAGVAGGVCAVALGLAAGGCVAPLREMAGPTAVTPMADGHGNYVTVARRTGARQGFLLLRPAGPPVAAVILFTGGSGRVGISPQGMRRGGNFLVRSRWRFVEAGFLVAVVDVPTDRATLDGFRTTEAHALDIKGVIAHLRALAPVPVWLVGTSRGTISAANAAARLDQGGADGLVLLSSLLVPGGRRDPASVHSVEVSRIRLPTLVVHHRGDRCPLTPHAAVAPLLRSLSAAPVAEELAVEGGAAPHGNPCGPTHFHGYIGIEQQVVARIADWIKAHPPRPRAARRRPPAPALRTVTSVAPSTPSGIPRFPHRPLPWIAPC